MRKINSYFVSLAIFCFLAATASATITGISFSGPGGTGADGLTGGNLTEPKLFYNLVDYIDLTITVDAAGTYTLNEAPAFGFVANNTGQTWTGFDLNVQSAGFGTLNPDWSDSTAHFPAVTQSGAHRHFCSPGGTLATGNSFGPFGTFVTTGAGNFIVRETPLIAAVPEPSSIATGALGTLGLVFFRRRNRQRSTR